VVSVQPIVESPLFDVVEHISDDAGFLASAEETGKSDVDAGFTNALQALSASSGTQAAQASAVTAAQSLALTGVAAADLADAGRA